MPTPPCITFFSDSCVKICQKTESLGFIIAGMSLFMSTILIPRDSWALAIFSFAVMLSGLATMVAGLHAYLRSGNQNHQEDAVYAIANQL